MTIKESVKEVGKHILTFLILVVVLLVVGLIAEWRENKELDKHLKEYDNVCEDVIVTIVDGDEVHKVVADVQTVFEDRQTIDSVTIYLED